MMSFTRRISARVVPFSLRLQRAVALRRSTGRKAAVLLPVGDAGSLGDEAMLHALAGRLAEQGFDELSILEDGNATAARRPTPTAVERVRTIDIGDYLRTTTHSPLRRIHTVLCGVLDVERLYVIGADMMDGFYSPSLSRNALSLALTAAEAGWDVRFVGFSWNRNPDPECTRLLARLVRLAKVRCRDPLSYERLNGAIGGGVEETMDIAFLLRPDETGRVVGQFRTWADGERRLGRTIVGLNLSSQLLGRGGLPADPDAFADFFVAAVRGAVATPSLLLLPHDLRGEPSDRHLAERFLNRLPTGWRDHVTIIPADTTAAAVKGIVPATDVVLSGRMHLAIACLGQSVPVCCLTYQDKFDGLFQYLGLGEYVVPPVDCVGPEVVADKLRKVHRAAAAVATRIRERIGQVVERSGRNV
jgi:colanic acid/amylovoran biosynthesis protein